ncbi:cytochrome bd ubiquinol oxidase, subunit ii [Heliomicrobium modesticaldum Ice1]|uniref:Cytochrome bd ubiquinol oxidase, subunit ii n=1 Tax=Heliobacterium modesticaldum (strain ATCC 51547 / Ice1) TaxID=498761 RepID=B0TEW5_HELMI|nr:cytochrome d ubiquinol oxidase subunit II [Heliomicrobium modesticaldum]ABZ84367.1 cytochrome bd ubiquinol oxidase, subunit ii [Heliomicrobium modesticaldum Ice1]
MMELQITWFVLVGVLLLGYALLDGFDLGVGSLYLLTKDPDERRRMIYSIGPYWDSNQVWLLTGGGAIFAAFPMVYATVFSGFYLALMLVLFALIFRAVSIEFQHQLDSPGWRKWWDLGFSLGSLLPSILYGVAVGNILRGIPLDANGGYLGDFLGLLNPYSLVMGLVSLSLFAMHGAAFIISQSDGALQVKARRWARAAWLTLLPLFLIGTAWSYLGTPRLFSNYFDVPLLWVFPLIALLGLAAFPAALKGGNAYGPLGASALTIFGLLTTMAASLFPYIVPASNNLANSLTVFNASSSERTLMIMLILALIGLPIVLTYTAYIYRTFIRSARVMTIGNKQSMKI